MLSTFIGFSYLAFVAGAIIKSMKDESQLGHKQHTEKEINAVRDQASRELHANSTQYREYMDQSTRW